MLPLTVDRLSSWPPLPTVPFIRRGLIRPVIVIGKSVLIVPLTVSARSSALRAGGMVSVMSPFTV